MEKIEYVATDRNGLDVCATRGARGWTTTLGRFPERRAVSPEFGTLGELEVWLRVEGVVITSPWKKVAK